MGLLKLSDAVRMCLTLSFCAWLPESCVTPCPCKVMCLLKELLEYLAGFEVRLPIAQLTEPARLYLEQRRRWFETAQ